MFLPFPAKGNGLAWRLCQKFVMDDGRECKNLTDMAEHTHIISDHLKGAICSRLSSFPVERVVQDTLRKAAVALVIAPQSKRGEASILITMRPQTMNRHSGQYALPGGRLDVGETEEAAALRELEEELGIRLTKSDVLGRLDDFPTRSGFCISPFVMWAKDLNDLHPDPSEVALVHHLSFEELDSPKIPRLTQSRVGEHPVLSAHFPSLGHYIYAPTAAILYQFREVAIRGHATRAAHFEQPAFAWK